MPFRQRTYHPYRLRRIRVCGSIHFDAGDVITHSMQFVCCQLKCLAFWWTFRVVGCCCRLGFLRLRSSSTYPSGFLPWELLSIVERADVVSEMADLDAKFSGELHVVLMS